MNLLTAFFVLIGLLALFVLGLFVFQRHLIYFPRSYGFQQDFQNLNVVSLEYRTAQGTQMAFYVPPRVNPEAPPPTLWLLFGGNAALALDWYDFAQKYPNPQAGMLLVEYPGYGHSQGKASPASILASTEAAVVRLAEYLKTERTLLEKNLNILGHSLGSGSALQYAVQHPTQRIVLVAPFTSLLDMACRSVGKPLCFLLQHRFDNQARLAELAQQHPQTHVHILHGDQDAVVPVEMGRTLGAQFQPMTAYTEVSQADHNSIFSVAEQAIYEAMSQPISHPNPQE